MCLLSSAALHHYLVYPHASSFPPFARLSVMCGIWNIYEIFSEIVRGDIVKVFGVGRPDVWRREVMRKY